ncbi:MAG: hypothetical protein CR984_00790, partial [Proteobacteria bacterium]
MNISERLYQICRDKAASVTVDTVSIGLGYTAVQVSNGGIGLAYTYLESKTGCTVREDATDFEAKPAGLLLEKIMSSHPLEKCIGMALVNALNASAAMNLGEDPKNEVMFDFFNIGKGTRVSMVGYFGPLMGIIEKRSALLEVLVDHRQLGRQDDFMNHLSDWTDVLILTSTALLNGSADDILNRLGPSARCVILGPSTPMIAEAFEGLPVHMLAGAVPVDSEAVFKGIRFGMGTPVLMR